MAQKERTGSGCWKAFAAGCGCLVLVVVIAVSLLLFNLPWLSEKVGQAKDAFDEMMTVRAALQQEYDTPNVHIGQRLEAGEGSSLTVTLIDPPLFDDPRADFEAKAREIATFTKSLLAEPDAWQSINVTLQKRGTSSSILSSTLHFSFRVEELPDAPDAPPDPDEEEGSAVESAA